MCNALWVKVWHITMACSMLHIVSFNIGLQIGLSFCTTIKRTIKQVGNFDTHTPVGLGLNVEQMYLHVFSFPGQRIHKVVLEPVATRQRRHLRSCGSWKHEGCIHKTSLNWTICLKKAINWTNRGKGYSSGPWVKFICNYITLTFFSKIYILTKICPYECSKFDKLFV